MIKQAQGLLVGDEVICNDDVSRELWNSSSYGVKKGKGSIVFLPLEALYLLEREKLVVKSSRKTYDFAQLFARFCRKDKHFSVRYPVYANLRGKGYVVKTALKFGADFRVYDKGVQPGDDHAKWVVYAVPESARFSWRDFTSKNRVAHSTKKRLLVAVVDDDADVSFFEVQWVKP